MSNPTDTNQASELYELCKEVYEKTGWNNQELLGGWVQDQFDGPENRGTFTTRDQRETILFKLICPLYTSDYLLEKLPKRLKHHEHCDYLTLWSDSETDWNAAYELNNDCENFDTAGDTPLKALLKLTIALSEAGELNG